MKILFLSPVPTDPPIAGNRVRILTLTTALRRAGHEVHFAYVPMEETDVPAMQARFGAGKFHVLKNEPEQSTLKKKLSDGVRRIKRVMGIDSAYTWGLDDWYLDSYTRELKALDAREHFDALCVEYVFMSKAFEAVPESCLRILDTHDSFGLRHQAFLRAGMRPRWFSTSLAEEERGFRRANAVLAIQDEEARAFNQRILGSRTEVIQVGHLIDLVPPLTKNPQPTAVFVGSDNPINVVGAEYFISKVLPLIRNAHPDFTLTLAGTVSKVVQPAPGVVKLGFVKDLKDAFAAGAIAVNPILMGTGVNIKLLDAMAFAMPCVSTESGARGLDAYRDSALMVVPDDDAPAFAAAVMRLLSDDAERNRFSLAARRAAETWNESQLKALNAVLVQKQPHPDTAPAALQQPVSSY